MDNKKILFINHACFKEPEFFDCAVSKSVYSESDWKNFLKLRKFNRGILGSYIRVGINVLPVKNDLVTK